MSGEESIRIAWFDDELHDPLGRFLPGAVGLTGSLLQKTDVHDEVSLLTGVALSTQFAPEAVVVDLRLGVGETAVDGIRFVQALSAHWIGPVVLLTRFPKSQESRRVIDPRIGVIEIAKPDQHDYDNLTRWFEKTFWPPLVSIVADSAPARLRDLTSSAGGVYLGLALKDLELLNLDERLERKAAEAGGLLEESRQIFEDDPEISYLLVAGWPPRVIRVGRNDDEIPGKDLIREEQRVWDAPAFVLRRPARVNLIPEEVGERKVCTPTLGPARSKAQYPDWFPTLEVEFGNTAHEMHFDTGADFTFLSYEALSGTAPARDDDEDWQPLPLTIGITPERGLMVSEWRVGLRARGRSGSLGAVVPVQLVRRFIVSGLDAQCRSHCPLAPAESQSSYISCRYRSGLIGRDVLRHTGWAVVVDIVRQKCFVLRTDDSFLSPHPQADDDVKDRFFGRRKK